MFENRNTNGFVVRNTESVEEMCKKDSLMKSAFAAIEIIESM